MCCASEKIWVTRTRTCENDAAGVCAWSRSSRTYFGRTAARKFTKKGFDIGIRDGSETSERPVLAYLREPAHPPSPRRFLTFLQDQLVERGRLARVFVLYFEILRELSSMVFLPYPPSKRPKPFYRVTQVWRQRSSDFSPDPCREFASLSGCGDAYLQWSVGVGRKERE